MGVSLCAVIHEDAHFGWPYLFNQVIFGVPEGDGQDFYEALPAVQPLLVEAAGVVQARFYHVPFLIDTCDTVTREEMTAVSNAFEFQVGMGLFFIPFSARLELPEPQYTLTDMDTYGKFFDLLRNEKESRDADTFWDDVYQDVGLVSFRLVLAE